MLNNIYNKKYLIKYNKKNAKYINRLNKRVYLQKGGTIELTDEFIQFISETIFVPVCEAKKTIETIQIMYDNGDYLLILYDFAYSRNIFYIHTQTTYDAFQEYLKSTNSKKYEKYIDEFKNSRIFKP